MFVGQTFFIWVNFPENCKFGFGKIFAGMKIIFRKNFGQKENFCIFAPIRRSKDQCIIVDFLEVGGLLVAPIGKILTL